MYPSNVVTNMDWMKTSVVLPELKRLQNHRLDLFLPLDRLSFVGELRWKKDQIEQAGKAVPKKVVTGARKCEVVAFVGELTAEIIGRFFHVKPKRSGRLQCGLC